MKPLVDELYQKYKSNLLDCWYLMRCTNFCKEPLGMGNCDDCMYDYPF